MKRIDAITIRNFKFAKGEVVINLGGKNAILYGQNGSGKSTIFWALYTFFESSFKSSEEARKYFDPSGKETLVNRFMSPGDQSQIKIRFKDKDHTLTEKVLSYDNINTDCELIREACYASDFINHRFLARMYDFRNSEYIDIFPTLAKDILQYVREDGENLGELWKKIEPGLGKKGNVRYPMGSSEYKEYSSLVKTFNSRLDRFLKRVVVEANNIIKARFKEDIIIELKMEVANWNPHISGTKSRSYKLVHPIVNLSIRYLSSLDEKNELKKPHTYLNEGRLTVTFLAIRLAIFRLKPQSPEFRFIALDDLLLSLDMGYRMRVLQVLTDEFRNHQQVIMTHDLGFYNLIRTYYDTTDWKIYKLRPDTDQLELIDDKTDDEMIDEFLSNGDYELCALFLRKKLEKTLKKAFQEGVSVYDQYESLEKRLNKAKSQLDHQFFSNFSILMRECCLNRDQIDLLMTDYASCKDLSDNTKTDLAKFHGNLISFVSSVIAKRDNITGILCEVERIVNRLHAGAHDSFNTPHYKEEIVHAIDVVKRLDALIVTPQYNDVAPKIKKVVTSKQKQDIIYAVEAVMDCQYSEYLKDQYDVPEIMQKIVELFPIMSSDDLDNAFDYLYNTRLDDMRMSNLDTFITNLIKARKLGNDDRKVIGSFVVQLLNSHIKLNARVMDKLFDLGIEIVLIEDYQGSIWHYQHKDS